MKPGADFSGWSGPALALSVAPPAEFIKAIRAHLKNGQKKQAYSLLLQANDLYPNDPVILSYFGWLRAVVDSKHRSSVAACRKAFVVFKSTNPRNMGRVYPILYLNLGRALLAAGKRKEAVEHFHNGLKHDQGNSELKQEMRRIGIRKKPPISFLSRSNPINKYVGKMLYADRSATLSDQQSPRA